MVIRLSYLHNGITYTGKMTSLYWINLWGWLDKVKPAYQYRVSYYKDDTARLIFIMGISILVRQHRFMLNQPPYFFVAKVEFFSSNSISMTWTWISFILPHHFFGGSLCQEFQWMSPHFKWMAIANFLWSRKGPLVQLRLYFVDIIWTSVDVSLCIVSSSTTKDLWIFENAPR